MEPEVHPEPHNPAELSFIRQRETLLKWWPRVAILLLLLLLGLLAYLLLKAPLLVRPDRVWEGLRRGTLDPATVQLLAAILPVVLLGWLATVALVLVFVTAGLANERKHVMLVGRQIARGELEPETYDADEQSLPISPLRFDHIVLTVRDVDASARFYCDVLGMTRESFGKDRVALRFGFQKINLHESGREYEPHAANPQVGSADVCVLTRTPIQKAMAHVQECGIPILAGPVERSGAMGPIISFYLRDPDGNLIEVARPGCRE